MDLIYKDSSLVVCVKPPRVLSTDEPGGMPELVRAALGGDADVRTVHRLDRVVSGLMVLARGAKAASELSRQIREDEFEKRYIAAIHGDVGDGGTMTDLLYRDKARKMTFVTDTPGKGVQEAVLDYETLARADGMSKVKITLRTGRTHQIRCQFASRGCPIVGDRKYGTLTYGDCDIALWSHELSFTHPETGERLRFSAEPPEVWPWTAFE